MMAWGGGWGKIIQQVGLVAAVVLPLWNIPLILNIGRRKSSKDISLSWAVGVFVCIVLMLPSAFVSPDPVLKVFGFANVVFFGGVVAQIFRYR